MTAIGAGGGEPAADAHRARLALERRLASDTRIGSMVPAAALPILEAYVRLLLTANRRVNLTRIVAPEAIADLHLLDALVALPVLDELGSTRAVDLGSGGGLPAIPLAIVRPAVSWTLVEAVHRKASILGDLIAALSLPHVTVLAERAEALGRGRPYRESFDLATARAVAPLAVLCELALPLLATGGTLLAWKGPLHPHDAEPVAGQAAADRLGGGSLSIARVESEALGGHTLVRVPKLAPTPMRYPRRPGEASRRPLA